MLSTPKSKMYVVTVDTENRNLVEGTICSNLESSSKSLPKASDVPDPSGPNDPQFFLSKRHVNSDVLPSTNTNCSQSIACSRINYIHSVAGSSKHQTALGDLDSIIHKSNRNSCQSLIRYYRAWIGYVKCGESSGTVRVQLMRGRPRLRCGGVGDVDGTLTISTFVECDAISLAVGSMEWSRSKGGFVNKVDCRECWWCVLDNSSTLDRPVNA